MDFYNLYLIWNENCNIQRSRKGYELLSIFIQLIPNLSKVKKYLKIYKIAYEISAVWELISTIITVLKFWIDMLFQRIPVEILQTQNPDLVCPQNLEKPKFPKPKFWMPNFRKV